LKRQQVLELETAPLQRRQRTTLQTLGALEVGFCGEDRREWSEVHRYPREAVRLRPIPAS
jgi:hypothetical protein